MRTFFTVLLLLSFPLGVMAEDVPVDASEHEFTSIFSGLETIDPKDRNYDEIVTKIDALCRNHPGSTAAMRAIQVVKKWREADFLDDQQCESIIAHEKKYNPGDHELKEIRERYVKAAQDNNVSEIYGAIEDLKRVARSYPGTLTEYYAVSKLPDMYFRIGEYRKARESMDKFFQAYPIGKSNQYGHDSIEHSNYFNNISIVAQTESIDKALELYDKAAEDYAANWPWLWRALDSGGEMALKNNRPDKAIHFFSKFLARFPDAEGDAVPIAKFRVAEAYLNKKEFDQARLAFQNIAKQYAGSRFENEAHDFIKYTDAVERNLDNKREAELGFVEKEIMGATIKLRVPEGGGKSATPSPKKEPIIKREEISLEKDDTPLKGEKKGLMFAALFSLVILGCICGLALYLRGRKKS